MTQPKIEIQLTPSDKTLEVLTMAAMGAYLVYIIFSYTKLPAQIPFHFGPSGEPDAWSSKATIFMLPAIALFIYILLTVINKYPHTFNYLAKITPENAAFHYQKACSLIVRLKAAIVFSFMYISWRTIAITEGRATGLGQWFIVVMLGLIFLPIVLYFVETSKQKEG